MTLHFTPLGVIFVLLTLIASIRSSWLLILVIIGSVFQAASIFNAQIHHYIFGFGIAYLPMAAFIVRQGGLLQKNKAFIAVNKPLIIFTIWAVLGAIILPFMFSGILVYAPRAGIGLPNDSLRPLVLSMTNVSAGLYLIFYTVFYLVLANYLITKPQELLIAFRASIAAFLLVLAVSLYQFLGFYLSLPWPGAWFNSHAAYTQLSGDYAFGGGLRKLSSTFTEASFMACYLSGVVLGLLVLLCKRLTSGHLLLYILAVIATLCTFSSTGYIAVLISISCLFLFFVITKQKMPLFRWLSLVVVPGLGFLFVLKICSMFGFTESHFSYDQMLKLLNATLIDKNSSLSYETRLLSNENAFWVFVKTYGLGAGAGSIRVSSFLLNMLATVGVVGSVLFGWFFYPLVKGYARVLLKLEDNLDVTVKYQLYFGAVTGGLLIAMLIAVPDMNLPFFWLNVTLFGAATLINQQNKTL